MKLGHKRTRNEEMVEEPITFTDEDPKGVTFRTQ